MTAGRKVFSPQFFAASAPLLKGGVFLNLIYLRHSPAKEIDMAQAMTHQAQAEALAQECADYATSLRSTVNVVKLEGRPPPASMLRAADLFERAAAHITQLEAQQAVPQGWTVTEEMHVAAVKVLQRANGLDGLPQRMLDAMLAAAPTPPGQESHPLTDGEIIAAQEALIEEKDALYRSRIGLQCTHCKKGTYRADGNGYYDFHRCDQCRYVPMWNADGTEFGIQEKRNAPPV